MQIYTQTSAGKADKTNEDSVFGKTWIRNGKQVGVIAIADGMGGYECGEKHSSLAIQLLRNLFENNAVFEMRTEDISKEIDTVFQKCDQCIKAENEAIQKMGGTTLTVCFCRDRDVLVKNIGDTRAYMISSGKLSKLSEDHVIFRDGVKTNQLTRCLGLGRYDLPYTDHLIANHEDCIFICSDGFYSQLFDEELLKVIEHKEDILGSFIPRIYERGEDDNISISLITL